MKQNNNTLIASIIVKKITGSLTEQEQELLDQWIGLSDRNNEYYQRMTGGDSYRSYIDKFPDITVPASLREIKQRIRRKRRNRFLNRVCYPAAAVVLILLLFTARKESVPVHEEYYEREYYAIMSTGGESSFILSDSINIKEWQAYVPHERPIEENAPHEDIIVTVTVPRGGGYKLELEDGTIVRLNAQTVLEYPEIFRGEMREVKLTGEAFFEVAGDPSRPFTVNLGNERRVEVLGTSFNIYGYPGSNNIYVTLVEGSVCVASHTGKTPISPLEQAVIDCNTDEITVNRLLSTRPYICWTDGLLLFEDATLVEIFDRMGRWFDIDIVYQGSGDLQALGKFSLSCGNRGNYTALLQALEIITGLEYAINENVIYITLPCE